MDELKTFKATANRENALVKQPCSCHFSVWPVPKENANVILKLMAAYLPSRSPRNNNGPWTACCCTIRTAAGGNHAILRDRPAFPELQNGTSASTQWPIDYFSHVTRNCWLKIKCTISLKPIFAQVQVKHEMGDKEEAFEKFYIIREHFFWFSFCITMALRVVRTAPARTSV